MDIKSYSNSTLEKIIGDGPKRIILATALPLLPMQPTRRRLKSADNILYLQSKHDRTTAGRSQSPLSGSCASPSNGGGNACASCVSEVLRVGHTSQTGSWRSASSMTRRADPSGQES